MLHVHVQMRHVEQIDAADKSKGWKTVPKFPRDAGIPWGQAYEGESGHVVYGHHARRRLQVSFQKLSLAAFAALSR